MSDERTLIETREYAKTRVSLEINDKNCFLVSIPTTAINWIVGKVSSILVKANN